MPLAPLGSPLPSRDERPGFVGRAASLPVYPADDLLEASVTMR